MIRTAIACIVEGHGEVEAAPVLIRRIAERVAQGVVVDVPKPIRTGRSKLVKPGEIERDVQLAAAKIHRRGSILVLIDADKDCPRDLGPELLRRARIVCADMPIAVVLAKREFEAWFLAAASSLSGKRGLHGDLLPPPDPEAISGAKEWLSKRMSGGHSYRETTDQPALTALFDLDQALGADSFDKCYRDVERLIREAVASKQE